MEPYRTVFVPAPRLPEGRQAAPAAQPEPTTPPKDPIPGLRGTPPDPPGLDPSTPDRTGQTGPVATRVDGEGLAAAVTEALGALHRDGYVPHSITPLLSGAYGFEREFRRHFETWFSAGAGYGYGTSYTEGVLIVARLA